MTYTVVGFGTLLNVASVGKTVAGAADKTYRPVIVPGFRRLFNLRPDHYEPSFKMTASAIESAAMNVEPVRTGTLMSTGEPAHFNGLAFEVDEEEFARLDERERYYERTPIDILDFKTRDHVGEGFVYASRPDARWIENDPAKLLPRWTDIAWARRGAYRYGEAFGIMYDRTTFLADGATLMVDYYKAVLGEADEIPDPA